MTSGRHCTILPVGSGFDIRTVQELMGHKDVKTTMIYTHVLNRGGKGVRSPLDTLRRARRGVLYGKPYKTLTKKLG